MFLKNSEERNIPGLLLSAEWTALVKKWGRRKIQMENMRYRRYNFYMAFLK